MESHALHERTIHQWEHILSRCARYCIKDNEVLLSAWPVISLNEWLLEQQRVLVLGSRCIYRVRYNCKTQRVENVSRTQLRQLTRVEYGRSHGVVNMQYLHLHFFQLWTQHRDGSENPWDMVCGALSRFPHLRAWGFNKPNEFPRSYQMLLPIHSVPHELSVEDIHAIDSQMAKHMAVSFQAASMLQFAHERDSYTDHGCSLLPGQAVVGASVHAPNMHPQDSLIPFTVVPIGLVV